MITNTNASDFKAIIKRVSKGILTSKEWNKGKVVLNGFTITYGYQEFTGYRYATIFKDFVTINCNKESDTNVRLYHNELRNSGHYDITNDNIYALHRLLFDKL